MSERIFIELNQIVCMCDDGYPAEALVKAARPSDPWQPYDPEFTENLLRYPAAERSSYLRDVRAVLRGLILNHRIENMRPYWAEFTPLQRLRDLDLETACALPRVSKRAAERTLLLVQ